jgi:murein DD-endopeptidase MepM/ murein hydrolase activator NlpD
MSYRAAHHLQSDQHGRRRDGHARDGHSRDAHTRDAHARDGHADDHYGDHHDGVLRHAHQAPPATPPVQHAKASDFTLGHGRYQVRLGPVAFWTFVGTLVIMAGWSIVTATYFAFHDDVLTRLIARQAEMQFAYEDRIADLRSQIDRVTSRQLLDQEQFERKLDTLLRKQATLESRAATIGAVADPSITGSIRQPVRGAAPGEPATGTAKPSPINDTVIFVAPPDREARLESRGLPLPADRQTAKAAGGGIEGTLTRFQEALDRLERRQVATLDTLEETYSSKARRIRGVLVDLGLDAAKLAPAKPEPGVGGPFVPAKLSDNGSFERQLHRIQLARIQVDRLQRTLVNVPIRKPIMGEIDTSSGFGVRMDPFLHGAAMHTGIDIRGNTGDPARATASGTVTTAGPSGGYGNMVEIDHGNGFATRYGHLSAIDVTVGQTVKIGQVVGRVGSTGRSTGPHLHYETRIDGEAVDPQRFLRAGIRLDSGS